MIIAENCTNWRDLAEAKEMIRMAKECGAGLSKFQLFDSSDDKGKPHYAWVKAHELTYEQAKELFDYGASIGQEVFFSVFGVQYVEWCERIGVKRYKLAYGESENLHHAKMHALDTLKPVLLSRRGLMDTNTYIPPDRRYLYCTPKYPALPTQFYLNQVSFTSFSGISDHTIGLDVAKIALARGAKIIEKHFCLEHNPDYPDDAWSMTPADLKELVRFEKVVQECL